VSVNGTFTAPAQNITNSGAPQPYTFDVNAPSGSVTIGVKAANTGTGRYPFVDIVTFPASGGGTDTAPPETTIDNVSQTDTGGRDVSISFSGTDNVGVTGFECRRGTEAFAACTSPKVYNDLSPASYTFEVRAKDAAGNVDQSPASITWTVSASAPTTLFPGIRWYPLMGVYAGTNQGWVSEPALIDQQYANYVGPTRENAYLDLDADDERYWFVGGRKIRWRDVLVNESLAPTSRAQAQDPNWSNYKWNQNDVITEMLNASTNVTANKAKLGIFVAVTATSERNPVPAFLMNDPRGLTWTDGQGKDHVRLDKQAGYEAVADFLIALTKRYGNDTRIASIAIGEYYTNPDGGGLPADLDYDAFRTNIKHVWSQVIAAAPPDADGERINIVQTQPILSGDFVTATDMANIGIGISGSGAQLFAASDPMDSVRQQLYGVVPLQHQVNTGPLGGPATWDGTPNPWGFTNGQTVPMRYEHVAWYHSNKGKVPLDSLYMRDNSTYISQWHEAYGRFGPNGTDSGRWGQIPNYPA
jgi:hypothetical protein